MGWVQVGRTARAGKSGRVTSLYGPENSDLVGVIKAALEAGGLLVSESL